MNKDLLLTLLSEERSIEERIESLTAVKDLLGNREIVMALATLATTEKSARVRRAMLDIVLASPEPLFEFLYTVIAREPEEDLRLAAIRRLAEIPEAEEILVECLLHDVSVQIQAACLAGIRTNRGALHEYASTAPASLKPTLLKIFDGDAIGLIKLLDPADPAEFKSELLDKLSAFPSMRPEALLAYLKQEPSRELRAKALAILMERTDADPEIVLSNPDSIGLLSNRLDAFPDLADKLTALLKNTRATHLKLVILQQLDRLDLFIEALSDPNPSIRRAGIEGCLKRIHRDEAATSQALMDAIPREPIPSLREAMLRALTRMSPEVEKFLIDWSVRETDPRLEHALAEAVVKIGVTDANREALLKIYLKILREPFFDSDVKAAVLEHLASYAHRNEPDLKQALIEMLERARDLDAVERIDKLVRLIEPDPARLSDLRLKVFYRFVGRYPIDPLVGWLREFRDMPHLRPQLGYLAAVTGATWILDAADGSAKSDLPALILDCIRKDSQRDADKLLHEAYENRTLKKKDLIALFSALLNYHLSSHNSYPLLDRVLKIMGEVKLATPEILDRCFEHLRTFPQGAAAYMLRKYLEETGPHEERLKAEFTAENYRNFCLRDFDARDTTRLPQYWTDSDHWRVWHTGWPIGELMCETLKDWKATAARRLLDPVDPRVPVQQSFHLYLLYQMWRKPELAAEERTAVGRLMRSVRPVKGYEMLFDRALFLFCDRWSGAATPEAAEVAAEAFAEQMRRRQSKLPKLLDGMSVDHLRAVWPWGDREWREMWETYGAYVKGERSQPDRSPKYYLPVENAASEIIDFLIGTPCGRHADVWAMLLGIAREHCGRMLEHRLSRAPEARRAELAKL